MGKKHCPRNEQMQIFLEFLEPILYVNKWACSHIQKSSNQFESYFYEEANQNIMTTSKSHIQLSL